VSGIAAGKTHPFGEGVVGVESQAVTETAFKAGLQRVVARAGKVAEVLDGTVSFWAV